MALSSYSELQASVLSLMEREGDAAIGAYLPIAVSLVEAKLNRNLRVSDMETNAVGTSDNGLLYLPPDFLEARRVEAYPYGALEQVEPGFAIARYPEVESGPPAYYTIVGTTLTTFPNYSGEVSLDYYQKIPALSDANQANWLLSNHPDIYLFLTLSEAYTFAKNYDEAQVWNQRGMVSVEELNRQDQGRRYSNVSVRVKGPTP